MSGPCTAWVTLGEVQAQPGAENLSDLALLEAIDVASELLYRFSGRQFAGECSDVVLPLKRFYNVGGGFPSAWWYWRSWWGYHTCGRPPQRAGGCSGLPELTLGAYPVREVQEVRIDGLVVDPTFYRVDDRRWLVWIDQTGDFGCCHNLAADPMTDLDTFQVTFTWGQAPPTAGVVAARTLAIELARANANLSCSLPQRVTSVTMQSISYVLLDPMAFLDKGRTGIYSVDLFLNAVNPHSLARRSTVISPDFPRPVRRAGTVPGS